jgi:Cyclin
MLGRLISHNDLIPLTPSTLTRFHSRAPPNITLPDYLRRIVKYTSVEKACLLTLLIYIDRVCERQPHFTISSLTVHRFLITAITVSAKALCDSYCTNSHYAKVGGISLRELNSLELEFLRLIDWRLATTGPVLQQYYVNLIKQHSSYTRIVETENETNNITVENPSSAKPGSPDSKPSLKRRRSSTSGDEADSHSSQDEEKEENAVEDTDEDDLATDKHFQQLLEQDSIPYIA